MRNAPIARTPAALVTIKQYAAQQGISASAARSRLEKLVREGKATRRVGFDQFQLPMASHGMRQPPPYKVNLYRIH